MDFRASCVEGQINNWTIPNGKSDTELSPGGLINI